MNTLFRYLFLVFTGAVLVFAMTTCDVINDIQQEPEEPVRDNPLDPDGDNFNPPEAYITNGPNEGQVLSSPNVTFQWTTDNNSEVVEFAYRLGDNYSWSAWSTNTQVNYPLLSEGSYNFQVKARYPERNNLEQETPDARSFEVNAVSGPALMFKPRAVSLDGGDQFITTNFYVDEIQNVVGLKYVLQFDPDLLEVDSVYVDPDAISSDTDFELISYVENDNASSGQVAINAAFAGLPDGVSGSGTIGFIRFRVKTTSSFFNEFVNITPASEMRNGSNSQLFIRNRVPLVINPSQ